MAMIADTADFRPDYGAPRGVSTKMDWGHAWRSLQKLLADKEDTRQVFEIMRALNGKSTANGYIRLLETPEGGRMAFERKEFADRLMDDAWLDSLPEGSVGGQLRIGGWEDPAPPGWHDLEIVPEPGLLAIFPSWYVHWTQPTQAPGPRMSIAFDTLPSDC